MSRFETIGQLKPGIFTLKKKIVFLMASVIVGLLASTLLIVYFLTTAELSKTLKRDLTRAQALFDNYQAVQTKEIAVENRLISKLPFLKALVSTKDRPTILEFAEKFKNQIGSDLFIITDNNGNILASTDKSHNNGNLGYEHAIQIALKGKESTGILSTKEALYQVTSAPLVAGEDSILGTLTIGFKFDDGLAENIKKMTDSEISFIVEGNLIASTWKDGSRRSIEKYIYTLKEDIKKVSINNRPSEHFDIKIGKDKFISVLVPLGSGEGVANGAYLIQRNRDLVMGFLDTIMNYIIFVGFGIFIFGSGISLWVAGQISDPIISMVQGSKSMAEGDFSTHINISQKDEIGVLATAFNEMSERLRNLISHVRENSISVSEVSQKLHLTSEDFTKKINKQETAVEESSSIMIQMGSSIKEVNKSVELLSLSANDTSSSILEMEATTGEIANHMDNLSNAIEVTSSSICEMTSSVKEIAVSIETLHNSTNTTASSLHLLKGSVQEVEINANKSLEFSENTTQRAEKGKNSVGGTITGMQEIQSSFKEAHEIISRLAQKSHSIGKIVKVIDEVAAQTNLLSLNAAIIAAQAGENGKSFAVVAEEVKSLADRTGTSTREIEELIKDVQNETANAVNAMANGSELVKKGVLLSDEAGNALGAIIESSQQSTEMVQEIVKATGKQSEGINEVNLAMVQIKEMVQHINRSTHEQEMASVEITKAVENMRVLGYEVKRSTTEQNQGSNLITTAVEKVIEMIHHILEATQEQSQGSEKITHALNIFRETAEENIQGVSAINNFVATLASRSQQLEQEINQFKV